MAADMTYDEAQEAADNNDVVTSSELQEMYPDKTMNHIEYDLAKQQAESELQSKRQKKHSHNVPRVAARKGRQTYNTGPKSVLADYEEAKLKHRAIKHENTIKRQQRIYMNLENTNETASKLTIIESKNQIRRHADHKSQEVDTEDESTDCEEDAAVLKEYTLQKMRILEENRARYGVTKEVTVWSFDEEVDTAPHNVWVIIHVYQDYLERCVRMNFAMDQIAKSYPHLKCLRARSDRLGLDTYPDIGLPTFIVFKNGVQLQNHIAVHSIIGTPFSVKDVEQFLITNNIITPVVVIPDKEEINIRISKKRKVQFSANHNDEDSDSELDID